MPKVVRVGDLCSGHKAYPPREVRTGSPNVFINGRPCAREHDRMQYHKCFPEEEAHDAWIRGRYEISTVFVNNRRASYPKDIMEDARDTEYNLLDAETPLKCDEFSMCKSVILTASHNVFFEEHYPPVKLCCVDGTVVRCQDDVL